VVFENGRWLGLVQGLSQSAEEKKKGKGRGTDCKYHGESKTSERIKKELSRDFENKRVTRRNES
jgi:hypothetical protein